MELSEYLNMSAASLIGKAQRPRCFKGTRMELFPVKYSGQSNAWMTRTLFHEWFHHDFIPMFKSL